MSKVNRGRDKFEQNKTTFTPFAMASTAIEENVVFLPLEIVAKSVGFSFDVGKGYLFVYLSVYFNVFCAKFNLEITLTLSYLLPKRLIDCYHYTVY